jgi:pimeloyl-ACP methyl ester carboxylesterase
MRDTLVRLVNEDYRDLLPAIDVPVELVWGAGDTAAPLEMAREAAGLLPQATLTVSDTSAHLLDPALVALLRERLT